MKCLHSKRIGYNRIYLGTLYVKQDMCGIADSRIMEKHIAVNCFSVLLFIMAESEINGIEGHAMRFMPDNI